MAEAGGYPSLGGYDDAFVEAVDEDFQCVICQLPLKDPILTKCGHKFCNKCLERHFQRLEQEGQPLQCPMDREDLSRERADIFPDKSTERKILSLAIKCPSEGCKWTGELRSKENHLESCPLKVVPCTNLNCSIKIARKDLQEHVTVTCGWRILQCKYCVVSHPACTTEDHQTECRRYPIMCPQLCGEGQTLIPREEIEAHIDNECPLTMVSCSFAEMGCTKKIQRTSAEDHLQSSVGSHLDLVCLKLKDTARTLDSTETQLTETITKLNETTAKLNETTRTLIDTQTRFSNTEQKLKDTTGKFEEIAKILVSRRPQPSKNEWKINLDELRFKVGSQAITHKSPPIYDKSGYRFRLILHSIRIPDPWGATFDISFVIMKGEYDSILPWPFSREVWITLCSQRGFVRDLEPNTFSIYSSKGGFENLNRPFHDELVCKPVSCLTRAGAPVSYRALGTVLIQVTIGPPE